MTPRPSTRPLPSPGVLLLVMLAAFGWWWSTSSRPVAQGAGVLVPEAPVQVDLAPSPEASWQAGDFRVTPLAQYHLRARVLGAKRYHFGAAAKLSPLDLVLGWGPMSDTAVLGTVSIRQSNRWYYWSTTRTEVPLRDIELHSANTHLIPATAEVARRLKSLRVGEVVEMTGYLVEATGGDGATWRSSLTRADTGAGACELFWVDTVRVLSAWELAP